METLEDTDLSWEDAVVVALYFAMVLGVGLWSSIKTKRDTVSGYFLASRNMHWIPVGASIFASNIGGEHFIGLAGSGAKSGPRIAGFELNAIYVILILGWFFIPVYMASGVYTMPEYLGKRFGGQRIRIYLSVLALMLYVLTKISADIYAGAVFVNQSIKLNMYGSVIALLAIASLFTIAGGLSAVIWTDFVQTILMLVGAFTLMVLTFVKVGGYQDLIQQYKTIRMNESFVGVNITNETCGATSANTDIQSSLSDPELPWTGMIFGLTINSVWYWCSDQVIVQRALSAKDLSHAKAGCILAGYLKLLPLFLLVLPGMASRVLFPVEVGCSDHDDCERICGSHFGCSNIAYPKLVLKLMPPGARGLMLSVMLAAMMSSLTSIFNSSSAIFSMDIWTQIRKQASETELLIVGRIFVLFLVVVSIIWIPVVQEAQNSQLFHYIQSVTSYFSPPVCSVYVLAILFERINEKGAFWGLMAGLVVGMTRFIWELSYTVQSHSEKFSDPPPSIISQVHYLHFGIILLFISSLVTVVISLLTEPIGKEHLYRLTFWSRHSKEVRIDISSKSAVSKDTVDVPMGKINVTFRTSDETETTSHSLENASGDDNADDFVRKFGTAVESPHADIQPPISVGGTEKVEKASAGKDLGSNPEISPWKRALHFMCGVSEDSDEDAFKPDKNSPEVEASTASDIIIERPLWKRICTANALILILLASFVWGYYGRD